MMVPALLQPRELWDIIFSQLNVARLPKCLPSLKKMASTVLKGNFPQTALLPGMGRKNSSENAQKPQLETNRRSQPPGMLQSFQQGV